MITTKEKKDVLQKILESISVNKKERIFSSNHILNDILNLSFFKDHKEQKINFLILFNLSEEILNNCRKGNYNLSNFYKNRLFNIYNFDLDGELKRIFGILYYPCIAYFEYCYGNTDYAINYLDTCIEYIKKDYELKNKHPFKSAVCEQMLNLYKCFFKMGNYQNAFLTSKEVLFYINKNFHKSEDYEIKFSYYLEEMFSKVSKSNTVEFSQIIENEIFSFVKSQYRIRGDFFNINSFSFIESNLDIIKKLPDILKLLIIESQTNDENC
jgi:hypothetical protein